ncbi:uncharacterized protein LOC111155744 isoform X2 [Enhydra lutris kenyoni]|uniref:Uncharacterized protein LOC111155744 isoform X2 n=1 Tax=Enhydra lutris kenyoni TaxID=391180 RepID=A0A2Y9KEA2_ENHLU|nr:uncharacterized protein LOC111155744 isoform X2 [Enhydra lutris kenyoni]
MVVTRARAMVSGKSSRWDPCSCSLVKNKYPSLLLHAKSSSGSPPGSQRVKESDWLPAQREAARPQETRAAVPTDCRCIPGPPQTMEHRSHSRGRSGAHSSAPLMWVTYFPGPQQGKWPPHRVPPVPSAPTIQKTCAPLPASNPLGSPFSALVPASESLLCPLQGRGAGSPGWGAAGAGQHPTTCLSPALPQPALCCRPPEDPGPRVAGSHSRALADLGFSLHDRTRSLFNPVQTRTHRYTDSRARVQHSRIQKTCVTRPYDTLACTHSAPGGCSPRGGQLQRGAPHCHFLLPYKTLTPQPHPFQTPSPCGHRGPGIGSEGPGPACPRCRGPYPSPRLGAGFTGGAGLVLGKGCVHAAQVSEHISFPRAHCRQEPRCLPVALQAWETGSASFR